MTSHREGVNPLRPYYIPPSIGEYSEGPASRSNPFASGNATSGKYASKARDIFSDIDYKDYLNDPSPSTVQTIKEFIDELVWKYTSVLMAQPFEVAKTILQARVQDDLGGLAASLADGPKPLSRQSSYKDPVYDEYPHSDSDEDEPAYFTSNVPYTPTPSTRSNRHRMSSPPESPSIKSPTKSTPPAHHLNIRQPDSIFEVISQLWTREGAWGVWKGTNATYLYTILQSLLENWSRSLLSALLNVPDLGVQNDVDRLVDIASPYPWLSLCVAATAAVATGLILAPLDLVRTRLLVTSTSRAPRRTTGILKSLPQWVCPSPLVLPTILNSLVHPLLTLSTPLVLRSRFMIDRELSPTTFSVAQFFSSCASLFVKLPLETVLRRGQMSVLSSPSFVSSLDRSGRMEAIIPVGAYKGVFGTMYSIVNEEGSRAVTVPVTKPKNGKKAKAKVAEVVYKKGQGLPGLWRGWKVSWWGLVGLWSASVVGGGGEGEF